MASSRAALAVKVTLVGWRDVTRQIRAGMIPGSRQAVLRTRTWALHQLDQIERRYADDPVASTGRSDRNARPQALCRMVAGSASAALIVRTRCQGRPTRSLGPSEECFVHRVHSSICRLVSPALTWCVESTRELAA